LRCSWIMSISAVGCVALLAASLSSATDSKPSTKPTSHSSASHSPSSKKGKHSRKSAHHRVRGQQKIDAKRTQQIQEALIREHYLDGKATGLWNDATEKAMQRYQADNNWQSKTTPDSRALIKLGLGPDHQHLLNPESAMTSEPQGTHGASISSAPAKADSDKQQR